MTTQNCATGVVTGVLVKDILDNAATVARTREENTIIYKKCKEPNQTIFTEKECYIAIEKYKNYPFFDDSKPLISWQTFLIAALVVTSGFVLRALCFGVMFYAFRTKNLKYEFILALMYTIPMIMFLLFIM